MAPKFGTSGLRGLVSELTDALCADYTRAFLGLDGVGRDLLIGSDLRPSSGRIAAAVTQTAVGMGARVRDCGPLPTPALALAAHVRARRLCVFLSETIGCGVTMRKDQTTRRTDEKTAGA